MADRKVQIELQITANAQQAREVLRGLKDGGGGSGGGGGGGGGGFSGLGNLATIAGIYGLVPNSVKAATAAGTVMGGPILGTLTGGATWAGMKLFEFGQKITDVSVSLSRIANPAQATLYEMAVNDLYGVLGQKLTPVVELATEAVRMFGDFLASVLPSSKEIRAALAPFKDALNAIKAALIAAVPIIRNFLLGALYYLAMAAAFAAGVLEGLFGTGGTFGASSRGAAARPAQQFGDINSAIEAMNLAAISGASIEDQQASDIAEIRKFTEEIRNAVVSAKRFGKTVGDIATGNTQGWGWLGDMWWGNTHPVQAQNQLNNYLFGG